jgi:transposase InsO family protein
VIDAEKATYPVTVMCRLLGVPRSSYYDWAGRAGTLTATAARRAAVAEQVRTVFEEYRQTYGCRRIARVLNTERGMPVAVGTVADIMRELGLAAVQPRSYKATTDPDPDAQVPSDAIGRDFTADAPGTRLVGDITYLRTGQGWLYLATVIDLCTRMVVGWAIAGHMRASLVCDALQMAHDGGYLVPGAVFHSDRGSQGGFQWSSQHLDGGGVRWDDSRRGRQCWGRCPMGVVGSGRRTGRCARRCARRDGPSRRGRCAGRSGG